jgi:ribonuclease P protein component
VPRHGQTAVARNRLRRRLRELGRRGVLPLVGSLDLVVRARRDAYRADRTALERDLEQWRLSLPA